MKRRRVRQTGYGTQTETEVKKKEKGEAAKLTDRGEGEYSHLLTQSEIRGRST